MSNLRGIYTQPSLSFRVAVLSQRIPTKWQRSPQLHLVLDSVKQPSNKRLRAVTARQMVLDFPFDLVTKIDLVITVRLHQPISQVESVPVRMNVSFLGAARGQTDRLGSCRPLTFGFCCPFPTLPSPRLPSPRSPRNPTGLYFPHTASRLFKLGLASRKLEPRSKWVHQPPHRLSNASLSCVSRFRDPRPLIAHCAWSNHDVGSRQSCMGNHPHTNPPLPHEMAPAHCTEGRSVRCKKGENDRLILEKSKQA